MENVQYLTDNHGERTSVVIPIAEWERLAKYIDQMDRFDSVLESVKAGVQEAKEMEATGERNNESVNDFLDAL